jgi:hypothetical protein
MQGSHCSLSSAPPHRDRNPSGSSVEAHSRRCRAARTLRLPASRSCFFLASMVSPAAQLVRLPPLRLLVHVGGLGWLPLQPRTPPLYVSKWSCPTAAGGNPLGRVDGSPETSPREGLGVEVCACGCCPPPPPRVNVLTPRVGDCRGVSGTDPSRHTASTALSPFEHSPRPAECSATAPAAPPSLPSNPTPPHCITSRWLGGGSKSES